jgi:hypothetical protein
MGLASRGDSDAPWLVRGNGDYPRKTTPESTPNPQLDSYGVYNIFLSRGSLPGPIVNVAESIRPSPNMKG